MSKFLLSGIIFFITIMCIFLKPFKKKEWLYTSFFGIIVLFLGLVKLNETIYIFFNIWNAALSLISIMVISLILDEVGFFKWAALTMVLTAEGSKFKLFFNIIILGSLISIFFNNDGAILILTPIIYEAMKGIGFSYKETIPFIFACGYIADTASTILVVSNLANIIAADTLAISFSEYLSKMIIPGIAIIITVTITMYFNYKKDLKGQFKSINIINPDDSVRDWILFNTGVFVLIGVIIGYFVGSFYNIPVSIISTIGAIILLIHGVIRNTINGKTIFKKAPWSILIFVFSMYLIVYSLYTNGLDSRIESILIYLDDKPNIIISLAYGIISTVSACFMNNLPSVMIGAIGVNEVSISNITKEIVTFSNVIGSDIGAKITPIGSLATIMWINILSQRGIKIKFKDYTITSLKVIVPPLIIGLIILAVL